jgi:hypothetical protein
MVKYSQAHCLRKALTGTAVADRLLDCRPDGLELRPHPEKTSAIDPTLEGPALLTGDAQFMRQSERKALILLEWDRWLQTQNIDPHAASARDSLKFFCELQDQRSALLEFRASGRDKWQVIHAWLLSEARVSD